MRRDDLGFMNNEGSQPAVGHFNQGAEMTKPTQDNDFSKFVVSNGEKNSLSTEGESYVQNKLENIMGSREIFDPLDPRLDQTVAEINSNLSSRVDLPAGFAELANKKTSEVARDMQRQAVLELISSDTTTKASFDLLTQKAIAPDEAKQAVTDALLDIRKQTITKAAESALQAPKLSDLKEAQMWTERGLKSVAYSQVHGAPSPEGTTADLKDLVMTNDQLRQNLAVEAMLTTAVSAADKASESLEPLSASQLTDLIFKTGQSEIDSQFTEESLKAYEHVPTMEEVVQPVPQWSDKKYEGKNILGHLKEWSKDQIAIRLENRKKLDDKLLPGWKAKLVNRLGLGVYGGPSAAAAVKTGVNIYQDVTGSTTDTVGEGGGAKPISRPVENSQPGGGEVTPTDMDTDSTDTTTDAMTPNEENKAIEAEENKYNTKLSDIPEKVKEATADSTTSDFMRNAAVTVTPDGDYKMNTVDFVLHAQEGAKEMPENPNTDNVVARILYGEFDPNSDKNFT
jgi:hypothetical protein